MPEFAALRTLLRRVASVTGVAGVLTITTLAAPLWASAVVLADLARGRRRLPLLRLGIVLWCWCAIELAGVAAAGGLWLRGRGRDVDAHFELMGWWSGRLMRVLDRVLGIAPTVEGVDQLGDGNAVVLVRHCSLADALVMGWVLSNRVPLRPRVVLKRELLADPCLDIVGGRVPAHFLDRSATDPDAAAAELAALRDLARGVGPGHVAVIFPEGTRASPTKRTRALARIATADPERASRLADLTHLLPPRPAGTRALLDGAPAADVVVAWHVGFDGLDSMRGIVAAAARPPVATRFVARRIPRTEVPEGAGFNEWLDGQWLELDRTVAAALAAAPPHRRKGHGR